MKRRYFSRHAIALGAVLAGSTHLVSATAHAQDAGAAPPLPDRHDVCGITGLSTRDLVAVDPARVLADPQHDPTWHAPTRVYWAMQPPTPARESGVLIFGDPTAHRCRAMTAEGPALRGPFAGFPGSNAQWRAISLWNERVVVVIVDDHHQPRAIRDLGEEFATQDEMVDCGVTLQRLTAFPDGDSVLALPYRNTNMTLHVLTGDGGVLYDTFRHRYPSGSLRSEAVRVQGPASATPTLVIQTRPPAHGSAAAPPELHWNAATHTFQ